MKFKSLLLAAGAALMTFSASATILDRPDYVTCRDAEGKVGEFCPIELVSYFYEASWTQMDFRITFAEGLTPTYPKDEDGEDCPIILNMSGPAKKHQPNALIKGQEYRLVFINLQQKAMPAGEDQLMGTLGCTPTKEGVFECNVYNTCLADASGTDYVSPPTKYFKVTVKASAVNDVTTAKEVASVKYYNVAGMESATPFDGVNVMVTTYVDGSKATSKVVK